MKASIAINLKCSKSSQDQTLRETWLTTQMEILPHAVFLIRLRATSHELGWPGWPGYRDQLRFGFLEEISARFPRWEKAKDPWKGFWREIREAKQTWRNTKAITFEPIIASATLTAVPLQLNGMLMMCTIQQAMRDDAIRAARSHPALFICSYGKMSSPFPDIPVGKTEFSGTKQAHPLIWTQRKFYKGFRGKARFRKPGQIGQPGSCEEALSFFCVTNRPLS